MQPAQNLNGNQYYEQSRFHQNIKLKLSDHWNKKRPSLPQIVYSAGCYLTVVDPLFVIHTRHTHRLAGCSPGILQLQQLESHQQENLCEALWIPFNSRKLLKSAEALNFNLSEIIHFTSSNLDAAADKTDLQSICTRSILRQ